MNANDPFLSASGGIAQICKECNLYDLLNQYHVGKIEGPSHITGKDRIDFIFVTKKILPFIEACGATAFYEHTSSNHRG